MRLTRVVIIGATGHIGSYLVPKLVARGHEVVAISRGDRSPYIADAAWAHVEKLHVDRAFEDAAGTFGPKVAGLRPDAVVDLVCFTVSSARQLLDALVPIGAYLLHCGSIWAHGPAVEVPVTEPEARQPFGDYGVQKAAIEELLLGAAHTAGAACTVLHPGHIVGRGWVPLNPAGNFNLVAFEDLAAGRQFALPHFGMETVHHVHASDLAESFCLALANRERSTGESFHVVSDRAITLRGYAESVATWFGQPCRLVFQPWEIWAAAHSPDDVETTYDHIAHSPSMSSEKASMVLGYRPEYTSLAAVHESLTWLVGAGRLTAKAPIGAFSSHA